jgi:hypothetical protein
VIWLLLTLLAPQESPYEPKTRAELNALSESYTAAQFDVAISANGRVSCNSTPRVNSATLSVQSCIMAANCAEKGERDLKKLVRCIERGKPGLLRAYRRDWLRAHPQ